MPEISCRLNRRITPQWRQCYEEIPHIRHQCETSKHQPLVAHLRSPLRIPWKSPENPLEISFSCFKLHRFPMKKTHRTSASRTWRWSSRVLTCGSTHFRVGCDLGRSMADQRHGHFVFFGTQRESALFFGGKRNWWYMVFICVDWLHSEKEIHVSAPQPSKTPYPNHPKALFIGQPLLTAHVRRQQFPSHCIKSSSNGAWLAGSDPKWCPRFRLCYTPCFMGPLLKCQDRQPLTKNSVNWPWIFCGCTPFFFNAQDPGLGFVDEGKCVQRKLIRSDVRKPGFVWMCPLGP